MFCATDYFSLSLSVNKEESRIAGCFSVPNLLSPGYKSRNMPLFCGFEELNFAVAAPKESPDGDSCWSLLAAFSTEGAGTLAAGGGTSIFLSLAVDLLPLR